MSKVKTEKEENSIVSFLSKPQVVMAVGSFLIALLFINYFTSDFKMPFIPVASRWVNGTLLPILESFALLMGATALIQRNARDIQKKNTKDSVPALFCLSIVVVMTIGFLYGGVNNSVYQWPQIVISTIVNNVQFALHGFFVMSACLRAFKFNSLKSIVAVIAMIMIVLLQAPIGQYLFEWMMPASEWLYEVGLTAGSRAIVIPATIGSIMLAIKILLGFEKEAYGFSEKGGKGAK